MGIEKIYIIRLPLIISALAALTSNCTKEKKVIKPNIIFVLTDDQRWDALGYAGNQIIQTPQIDKLAREGTWFNKAFVTSPICAASRASILTGMYERTHGYTFRQGQLKDYYMQLSYPVILRQNGYQTGFFGKLGVSYEDAEKLFDKAEIYERNNIFPNRKGYFYKTIGSDTLHLTRYTGYRAKEFINNHDLTKPFCLSLSFNAPHAHDSAPEQFIWQEKSDKLYTDIIIPPPLLEEDKYFYSLPKEVREGYNRLRWTWRFDTYEKYQHSVKGYYRMISEIDDEIGEIRELLKEKEIQNNTVIIFMSDNGYYLGERQLAGKWLMHDNSIQVPLIIYDPRAKKHYDISDMVLNIDITTTILDIANVEIPEEYQGMSLMPYVEKGMHKNKREIALFEHLWNIPQIPSSEGVRTKNWKYFRYRFLDTPEELYDLENDPLETNNLAQDPVHKMVVKELREKCDNFIEKYTKAKAGIKKL